mmetsp:Transcript_24428/g.57304  ORF Transcript_24428/g.57304 Transcript_24428/m.57304 type:complete len:644 (-) Transcript_24428:113-2044(-)
MGQHTNSAEEELRTVPTLRENLAKERRALSAVLQGSGADVTQQKDDDNASLQSSLTAYKNKEAELMRRLNQIQAEKEAQILEIHQQKSAHFDFDYSERDDDATGRTLETSHSTDEDESEEFNLREEKPKKSASSPNRRRLLKRQKSFAKRYESSYPMPLTELMQREAESRKLSIINGPILVKKGGKESKGKAVRFATSRKYNDKVWCLIRQFEKSACDILKSAIFWSDIELDLLFAKDASNNETGVDRNFLRALRACYDPVRTPALDEEASLDHQCLDENNQKMTQSLSKQLAQEPDTVGAVKAAARPVANPDIVRPFCRQHRRAVLKVQKEMIESGQYLFDDEFWTKLRQVSLNYSVSRNPQQPTRERKGLKKTNSYTQLLPREGMENTTTKKQRRSLSPRRTLRKTSSSTALEAPKGEDSSAVRSKSPRRSLRKSPSSTTLEMPQRKAISGQGEGKTSPRRSIRKSTSSTALEAPKGKESNISDPLRKVEGKKKKTKKQTPNLQGSEPGSSDTKSSSRASLRKDKASSRECSPEKRTSGTRASLKKKQSSPQRNSRKKLLPQRSDSKLEGALQQETVRDDRRFSRSLKERGENGAFDSIAVAIPLSATATLRRSWNQGIGPGKGFTMSPVPGKKAQTTKIV